MLFKETEHLFSNIDTYGINKVVATLLKDARTGVRATINDRDDTMKWLEIVNISTIVRLARSHKI